MFDLFLGAEEKENENMIDESYNAVRSVKLRGEAEVVPEY